MSGTSAAQQQRHAAPTNAAVGSHNISIHLDHPAPHPHHHHYHEPPASKTTSGPQPHTFSYYRNCTIGGALSSSLRWFLCPIDSVKCNMQVHPQEFGNGKSLAQGLQLLYQQGRLYKGLSALMLAYGHQTGIKYPLYEYNKHMLTEAFPQTAQNNPTLIYLTASGSAEAVADVFMCPYEIIKVQLQTAGRGATLTLSSAALALWRQPQPAFNSAIGPIWLRQVPGTCVNFLVFEHSVKWIYQNIVLRGNNNNNPPLSKHDCSVGTQLAVTVAAGYISGFVSGVVSHPFDSLVSLQSRHPELSVRQLIHKVGWMALWRGLGPRLAMMGSLIAYQWLAYDAFKTAMGMGTTGG